MMSCTCISDTVDLVGKDIAESVPGAESIRLHAVGNAICINTETGRTQFRYCVQVAGHYLAPKKAGGLKRVTKTIQVAANFCPFCGVAA